MEHSREIIEDFKNQFPEPDDCLKNCLNATNVVQAIDIAANGITKPGKRHSHQYRIKKEVLKAFSDKLITKQRAIELMSNFEELYKFIKMNKIKGIGDLAIYDTATRISFYLKCPPDKIYLHAGTRKGVEALLREKVKGRCIEINKLPKEFRISGLHPWQLEVLFCVYKHRFESRKSLSHPKCV